MREENNILIVDDSRINCEYIGSFFQNKGIGLRYAMNGKEALLQIEKECPDLILLDVVMPEMDGYTVCKILKQSEKSKHIPVIFLTSKNDTKDLVKGFKLGAVDYINKPFNRDELLSRVITHLELKKSRDLISEQKKELHLKNVNITQHAKTVDMLNQEMKAQNLLLQEVIKTKDKFFSIISHDLKGPLGNIITFTDIIISGYKGFSVEKQVEIVQGLKDSAVSSNKLLENLLEWARSQSGALKINTKKLNINELIRELLSPLEDRANFKGVHLEITFEKEYLVYADESMLTTIIRNLISNAIKFTPSGGIININLHPFADNPSYIQVEIKDNGVGIKKETIDTLFQIDKSRSTKGTNGEKGTGLGLVLCKEFVEKNKGRLTATSELDKGSSFCFTIPLFQNQ